MALPQQNRLRSSRDFSKVYRKGKRAATRNLAVRAVKRSNQKHSIELKHELKQKKESVDGSPSALLLRSDHRHSAGHRRSRQTLSKADPPSTVSLNAARTQIAPSKQTSQGADNGVVKGPCFGISISRKVHKRAVVRNRIKRQLKAIIREKLTAIAPEWQIVIVVRPPAVECSFDEFLRELEYLLQKLAICVK